jgi:hypothetical protein
VPSSPSVAAQLGSQRTQLDADLATLNAADRRPAPLTVHRQISVFLDSKRSGHRTAITPALRTDIKIPDMV